MTGLIGDFFGLVTKTFNRSFSFDSREEVRHEHIREPQQEVEFVSRQRRLSATHSRYRTSSYSSTAAQPQSWQQYEPQNHRDSQRELSMMASTSVLGSRHRHMNTLNNSQPSTRRAPLPRPNAVFSSGGVLGQVSGHQTRLNSASALPSMSARDRLLGLSHETAEPPSKRQKTDAELVEHVSADETAPGMHISSSMPKQAGSVSVKSTQPSPQKSDPFKPVLKTMHHNDWQYPKRASQKRQRVSSAGPRALDGNSTPIDLQAGMEEAEERVRAEHAKRQKLSDHVSVELPSQSPVDVSSLSAHPPSKQLQQPVSLPQFKDPAVRDAPETTLHGTFKRDNGDPIEESTLKPTQGSSALAKLKMRQQSKAQDKQLKAQDLSDDQSDPLANAPAITSASRSARVKFQQHQPEKPVMRARDHMKCTEVKSTGDTSKYWSPPASDPDGKGSYGYSLRVAERRNKEQQSATSPSIGLQTAGGTTRRSSRRSQATYIEDKESTPPAPPKWSQTTTIKPWKYPVSYPDTGPRKASVGWVDLPHLDEGEFLNDSIIGYCLRKVEEEMLQKDQVHFFNSFFYTALSNVDGRSSRSINYDAVKKWTKGKDLLATPFIVVPINQDMHWFTAIICNLPSLCREVVNLDPESQQSPAALVNETMTQSSPPATTAQVDDDDEMLIRDDQSANHARETVGQASEVEVPDSQPEYKITFGSQVTTESQPSHVETTSKMDQLSLEDAVPAAKPVAQEEPFATPTTARKQKRKPAPRKFDVSRPSIIILDSLGSSRSAEVASLKDYIIAEAKEKRGIEVTRSDIQGVTAKGLPEQENFCDCGVYLIAYLQEFAKKPRRFVNMLLSKEDLSDWKIDASKKRNTIRDELIGLHAVQAARRKEAREQTDSPVQIKQSTLQQDSSASPKHSTIQQEISMQPPHLTNKQESTRQPKHDLSVKPADNELEQSVPRALEDSPRAAPTAQRGVAQKLEKKIMDRQAKPREERKSQHQETITID